MKALVTGAGGFSGRHLVQHLLAHDVEVHTIGARAASAHHHLADLADAAAVRDAIDDVRPDYVYHLAGVSSGPDVAAYYRVNTVYAATLLRAVEAAGLACPVLIVGTAAEYGVVSADQLPIAEDTPPRPYNHYGISKLAQTQMALALADRTPLVVVRPFNLVGPGMPGHGAVQSFAGQTAEIIAGRRPPAIAVGNLDATRDFVAVEDAVAAYSHLLRTPEAYGMVINVCSGVETSMRAVVDALVAEAGIPIEIRVDPALVKPIDVPRHVGSVARLRTLAAVPDGRVAPMLRRVLSALVSAS